VSTHPSAHRTAVHRTGAQRRSRRDSDALMVTVLTMLATIVAAYDLLLLGVHVQG
jgi:hypothetical protein